MRNIRRLDQVTLKHPMHIVLEDKDNPTGLWPPEVISGIVTYTKRQPGRSVWARVKPDPPGFGEFWFLARNLEKEVK